MLTWSLRRLEEHDRCLERCRGTGHWWQQYGGNIIFSMKDSVYKTGVLVNTQYTLCKFQTGLAGFDYHTNTISHYTGTGFYIALARRISRYHSLYQWCGGTKHRFLSLITNRNIILCTDVGDITPVKFEVAKMHFSH